jgi:hypothetical protein
LQGNPNSTTIAPPKGAFKLPGLSTETNSNNCTPNANSLKVSEEVPSTPSPLFSIASEEVASTPSSPYSFEAESDVMNKVSEKS